MCLAQFRITISEDHAEDERVWVERIQVIV